MGHMKCFPDSRQGVNKDRLVPAKRRGASLSRAMRGGSRSTVLSLSVTKPWYVGSSHGLCLLTVFKNRRRRKDIGQVRITIFNATTFGNIHPLSLTKKPSWVWKASCYFLWPSLVTRPKWDELQKKCRNYLRPTPEATKNKKWTALETERKKIDGYTDSMTDQLITPVFSRS